MLQVEAWMLQHLVSMVVGRYQNDSSFVDKFSETQQIGQFYMETKEIKKT
jgi:hypothetical protein